MRNVAIGAGLVLLLAVVGRADDPAEPQETVIRLTVSAVGEHKPALYHQLLPELKEMNPGNPVLGYLKCFMEQDGFFGRKDVVDQREKYLEMPLKDLPVAELRGYGGIALTRADEAARLTDVDWQTLLPLRRDGISLLVPEVQKLRSLANALQVRMRGEVADRRFDDALVTAKTLLALSRHVGEHPTLIGGLVGLAVAAHTFETLGEFIGQPGAPNLYWALTDLPNPLIGWRTAMQGERMWLGSAFKDIPGRIPLTEEQRKKLLKVAQDLSNASRGFKEKQIDVEAWLVERGKKPAHLEAARKRLIESGFPPGPNLDRLPAWQVILVDEVVSFEIRRDNDMKRMNLPYWQYEALAPDATKKGTPPFDPFRGRPDDDSLFGGLVKAFHNVRRAHTRLEQRVALLRCVEGLRLYAAAHAGALPEKLADVPVPLPVDPMNGKAFAYTLKDGTATLRGTAPAGMEKQAVYNIRYEIKIAK
jgi:hypothetical protein